MHLVKYGYAVYSFTTRLHVSVVILVKQDAERLDISSSAGSGTMVNSSGASINDGALLNNSIILGNPTAFGLVKR